MSHYRSRWKFRFWIGRLLAAAVIIALIVLAYLAWTA
jgi:hypothetical protein